MLQSEDVNEPEVTVVTQSKFFGYVTFIGGSFLQFTIGVLFTLGNLVPYFASYGAYAVIAHSGQNLSYAELQRIYNEQIILTNWIYFVYLLSISSGMYAGSYLEIRFGIRKAVIVASLCMSFGFGSTFFALTYGGTHAVSLSILTIGILSGLGTGMGYPLLLIVGMRWFPNKRGFVGGLCQGLMAGGGFFFDSLQAIFVNPADIKYAAKLGLVEHPEIIARIPFMFLYIGIIMTIMQVISIACISNPPWFTADEINVDETLTVTETGDTAGKDEPTEECEMYPLSVKHAVKFRPFWVLFLLTFFYCLVSTVALLQWKVFAVNYLILLNDEYLSLIGSSSSLIMGFGRTFWGIFFDWTGHSFRLTQSLMSLMITVFIFSWPICIYSPMAMYPVWIFAIWFNVNGIFAIFPSVISMIFGAKYVGAILGCFTFAETLSVLCVVGITPHLHQWFGGWVGYFVLIGAFGLCTVVLANFLNQKIDRKQYLWNLESKTQSKRLLMVGSDIASNLSGYNYATFNDSNSNTSGNIQQ